MSIASVILPDDHLHEMKKNLWFVCAVSNPPQWRSRYNLYNSFRKHITEELKANLLTVECALGGGFHCTEIDLNNPDASSYMQSLPSGVRILDVRVRNSSWIWLKENLQNIGVKFLPASADIIIFCDADIRFLDPNVIYNTIYHLNGTFKVVQPFQTCVDLGPSGDVIGVHQSFGFCINHGMTWNGAKKRVSDHTYYGNPVDKTPLGQNLFHPGYCLAMKKSTWQKLNGLLEVGIAGAGDHHMVTCFIGRGNESYPQNIHENYKSKITAWQTRSADVVKGSFGWINGTIAHSYHGPKRKRAYVERWSILTKNKFNPESDIYHNSDGVLELIDNVGLRNDLQNYFRSRNEDDDTS